MLITRRGVLLIAAGGPLVTIAFRRGAVAAQAEPAGTIERRVSTIIRAFEQQGFHRTATTVDGLSGDWLCEEVRRAGLVPERESFPVNRVDPGTSVLVIGDRRIQGLPLFDGSFTDASGVRGRLGTLGSGTDMGLVEIAPNAAGTGPLGDARRKPQHKAIVCVTRGGKPGLCPSNADDFLEPFGPPVLQVSSEDAAWLAEQAQRGATAQLIAQVTRTAASAFNVTATIAGSNAALPPLVVMTPRSGWYSCASERGGGIACWLEVMRALRHARLDRTVLFVASSGHELGHLGIDGYVDRRPGLVPKTVAWMHFGANIGAATNPANTLQASDDDLDGTLTRAMTAAGLRVDRRVPRGTIPNGEAEAVHRGGGRYVSIIGRNALFHNPDDRGPEAVDPVVIATFSQVFTVVARALAARSGP